MKYKSKVNPHDGKLQKVLNDAEINAVSLTEFNDLKSEVNDLKNKKLKTGRIINAESNC